MDIFLRRKKVIRNTKRLGSDHQTKGVGSIIKAEDHNAFAFIVFSLGLISTIHVDQSCLETFKIRQLFFNLTQNTSRIALTIYTGEYHLSISN